MRYSQIGGKAASVIGFGGWAIGGDAYGPVPRHEAADALQRALELGVTVYDTANIYGDGRSEQLIGALARGDRDALIIATKGGYVDYARRLQDFSTAALSRALDASLDRLETCYVDAYFLHSPPREVLGHDDAFDTLKTFANDGRIRLRGVSVRSVDDAAYVLETRPRDVDVIQLPFSLLEPQAARLGVPAKALAAGVHVIARAPLCFGFLAGTQHGSFPTGDHRGRIDPTVRERWTSEAARFDWLAIAGSRTLAQAALQFCLSPNGITCAIPGARHRLQVEANIAAVDAPPLSTSDLERIAGPAGWLSA